MKTLTTFFLLCLVSCSLYAQNIFYVRTDGNDANTGRANTSSGAKATLSSAVSAASNGDVIQIGPGNFSGTGFNNISMGTKYLRIIGSGSGTNPANATIISGTNGQTFLNEAAGSSSAFRMEVWNMRLTGFSLYFALVDSNSYFYNLSIVGDTTYSQRVFQFADDAAQIDVERCDFSWIWNFGTRYDVTSENSIVFYLNDNDDLYHLNVRQCTFDNNYICFYFSQTSAGTAKSTANQINITNCAFTNNSYKGMYAEKVENCTIENCSFINTGKSILGHPAAIDVNLKWETFSGDFVIRNCYFSGCAIPNSGTNVNGAAVLFKVRDFGGYAGDIASYTGNFRVINCIFSGNNAGIRFGESNNGSGTGITHNANYGSGTFEIKQCIIQNNTGGSYNTFNHFGIRNVTTRAISVTNCYFGGAAASTNSAFSGPIDVSSPHSGSSTVTGTLTTGNVIRLNSSDVYQANYTTLADAITGANDGDQIIFPPASIAGTTTINKSLTFIMPGAGSRYNSHQTTFQNLTVTGNKTLTLASDIKVNTNLSVGSGNGLTIGAYRTLELSGTLSSGGTFTGGVSASVPNSEWTISGSGSLTLPAVINGLSVLTLSRGASDTIYLGANLTLTNVNFANGYFNLNGNKLTVNGATLFNAASFIGTATGSELEIAGTNRTFQFSGGTIANLNVNRNQGTQLTGDLVIGNTLTLSNGSLFLGNFNCTLEPTAVINGTPGNTKMIIATGSGQLRKRFNATGSFTFPVGDDQGTFEYSPVTLNFTSGTFGSGAFAGVNLSNIKHPSNTSTSHFISRYWTVTQTNISAFSCAVSCTYTNADISGTETSMISGKFSSGTWVNMGAIDAASNLIQGTATSFSDFTGGESSALPVTWLTVSATKVSSYDVELDWATAAEFNTDCFTPQVSADGVVFTDAGPCMKGAGFSLTPHSYTYLHRQAFLHTSGTLYYRIKESDADGKESFSAVVPVSENTSRNNLMVFPNPVENSSVTISLPQDEPPSLVKVLNTSGVSVFEAEANWSDASRGFKVNIPVHLPEGVYLLFVQTPLHSYAVKLIK